MMKRFKKLWLFVLSALIISICAAPSFAQEPPLQDADLLSELKQTGVQKVSLNEREATLQEYDLNGVRFSVVNLPEGVSFGFDDFREMNSYISQAQQKDLSLWDGSRIALTWTTNRTWSKDKYNSYNPDCLVYTEGTGQRAADGAFYYVRSRGGCSSSAILGSTKGTHTITETYSSSAVSIVVDWPPGLTVDNNNIATVSTPPVYGNSAYLYREDITARGLTNFVTLTIESRGMVTLNNSSYPTTISDRVKYMD